jgi:hypothetical protein
MFGLSGVGLSGRSNGRIAADLDTRQQRAHRRDGTRPGMILAK